MSNGEGEDVRRQESTNRLHDEEASPGEGRPSSDFAELVRRLHQAERLLQEERRLREEERRLHEEERRLHEEERRLHEEERRLHEEERRLHEEERRLHEEERRLNKGTYYATIDQVWRVEHKEYNNIDLFTALIRTETPSFKGRGESMIFYTETMKCALNAELIAADEKSKSHSSIPTQKKIGIWPKDIFGNEPYGAEIAHLIPANSTNASQYFDVVIWALGLPISTVWDTLQKAIHGAKPKKEGNRIPLTGIKHSVSNKIRLASQFTFFDQDPFVLIIPIMNRDEMRCWNGKGYNALVMCGSWENCDASTVCQSIRMTNNGRIALDDEIKKARQLLEDIILGLAYSFSNFFESKRQYLDTGSQDIRSAFLSATGMKKVAVPQATDSAEVWKVRVVEFSSHSEEEGHPAPDPLLLAVKAAVNWSRRHKQPLRATGEPPEEEDELDVLAEEEFLEWRNNLHRPKTWDDLARGLGQTFGYEGNGVNL